MFVNLAGFADRMNLKMVAKSWVWGIERRTGLLLNRLSSGMEAEGTVRKVPFGSVEWDAC